MDLEIYISNLTMATIPIIYWYFCIFAPSRRTQRSTGGTTKWLLGFDQFTTRWFLYRSVKSYRDTTFCILVTAWCDVPSQIGGTRITIYHIAIERDWLWSATLSSVHRNCYDLWTKGWSIRNNGIVYQWYVRACVYMWLYWLDLFKKRPTYSRRHLSLFVVHICNIYRYESHGTSHYTSKFNWS